MTLSTLELAQLRSDQSAYLPDTCTLQTKTEVSDEQGGFTVTWANTHTSVACRVAAVQSGSGELIIGDQLGALSMWQLTVAHDQALDVEMRCVHVIQPVANSVTYEIVSLHGTHSNRGAKRARMMVVD